MTSPSPDLQRGDSALKRHLPALGWLRSYDLGRLPADALAGLTLAAYLLPAGIGDASLANLPPEAGLYACLMGGAVFWIFCSSRHTVVTVTSAISLLIGTSLREIAGGETARFAALAATTTLLVALIAFAAWVVRAGALVSFISESVMVGFKCGVAFFLASTQLPKLFGFSGAHGSFWENASHFLGSLGQTNASSLLVGATALVVLVLGKIFLKNKPVALVVVVAGILAAEWLSLEARGVRLLGEVPQGLPQLAFPRMYAADLKELLPLAFACFLLGAVETAAIGRMFATKHGNRFDANQELLALSVANLGAAVGRGFPVSGGMSQSIVNEGAGARTPLSGAVAAGLLLIVILFLSRFLRALPQPALAAIVLVAVAGLFQPAAFKNLWRSSRAELAVALATLLGVLGTGLLRGVLIGAVLSLVQLLRRASAPHVATLGRIGGTRRFSDRERNPENEPVQGVLILRPESSLVYFNVEHVGDTIASRIRSEPTPPGLVILDLSASPHVDLQSAHALAGLAAQLDRQGIRLRLVEARSSVRERLRREGLAEQLGGIDRFTSVADAVDAFQAGTA